MTHTEAEKAVSLLQDRCNVIHIDQHDNDDHTIDTYSVDCTWRDGNQSRFYSIDQVEEHLEQHPQGWQLLRQKHGNGDKNQKPRAVINAAISTEVEFGADVLGLIQRLSNLDALVHNRHLTRSLRALQAWRDEMADEVMGRYGIGKD